MQIADEFSNASSVNLVNKCRKCFFFRYNILDNCWSIVLRSKLINKVQTVLSKYQIVDNGWESMYTSFLMINPSFCSCFIFLYLPLFCIAQNSFFFICSPFPYINEISVLWMQNETS